MNENDILGKSCQANVAKTIRSTLFGRTTKILIILTRILCSFALMAMSLFCVFGFLDSFEPGNGSFFWKLAYGTLACGCLLGTFVLLRGLFKEFKMPFTNL
jgi:hypothetical protein